MFEKFGRMASLEELNMAAEGLKNEGDKESLEALALENGVDSVDVDDYVDGYITKLFTPLDASLSRLDIEAKDINAVEIVADWVTYIKSCCIDDENMRAAVLEKDLKGCIKGLLVWSFKNMYEVDKSILKAAGVNQNCKMGIPGMGRAKTIITEYYLGKRM